MKTFLIISAILTASMLTRCKAKKTSSAHIYSDVAYASVSPAQKMDIYLPEGNGPFPVVVLIHGGAFKMGDKEMESENAEALVAKGYAAVSINYRLSGEAQFPAQIEDCKTAVRFIRANATTYHFNPDKIGSWGSSAGGNLSALIGTSSGIAELEGATLGNSEFSSKVMASVDWFGPINFLTMDAEAIALGMRATTNNANSPESELMGAPIQTITDKVAKANPTNYITSDDAAFFIQVGSKDERIPYTQSVNFYKALDSVLGSERVSFELLEGANHGGDMFSDTANVAKVIAFFDKFLK